jgi:hypothetical protein
VLARPEAYRALATAARKTICDTYDFNTVAYPRFEAYLRRVAAMKPASAV